MCVSRAGTIFSGIFCLIEALAWLGLSLAGLLVIKCKIHAPGGAITILLDVYFNYGNCEPISFPGFPNIQDYTIPPDWDIPTKDLIKWPTYVDASERTERWLLAYVILSGTWIFTSIMLIIGASIGSKGPFAATFYIPWILNTIAICVADVIATIIYGLDISKTLSTYDLLKFVNVENLDSLRPKDLEVLQEQDKFAVVPSVIMTVIFSRGVLFWVLNMIFLLTTIIGLNNNMKRFRASARSKGWQNTSNLWVSRSPPPQQQQRKDSTETIMAWSQENPWQVQPRNEAPPTRMFDAGRNQHVNGIDNNAGAFVRSEEDVRSSLRENGMPTELRNGLPWSYFSSRDELSRPPKPNKDALEPMPPVPPPDYTLKFPQFTRPGLGNDYRGSWDNSFPPTPVTEGVIKTSLYIPVPDYDKKRLPSRMMGMEASQDNSMGYNTPHTLATEKITASPFIPPPDYGRKRVPPKLKMPSRPQMDAGRSYPNQVSGDANGYREPQVPPPDYNKPTKRRQGDENLRQRPLHVGPHLITRGPNRTDEPGRNRHNGYY